jgi:hypothetical protein
LRSRDFESRASASFTTPAFAARSPPSRREAGRPASRRAHQHISPRELSGQFALFRGIQDDHRDHDSGNNLLNPHTLEVVGNNSKHTWDVDGLHLEVVLAGGSREECESWFVTLKRSATSSH